MNPPVGTLDDLLRAIVREALREELVPVMRRELVTAMKEALSSRTAPLTATEYVSAAQAAEIAGVTPATVRGWLRTGKLPSHHAGRLLRVRVDELHAFLEGDAHVPAAAIDIDARARTMLARRGGPSRRKSG